MQALWLENKQLRLRDDLPQPVPGAGQALVKVRLAGICATDLEMVTGYYDFAGIPGHEFIGQVVESPAARSWEGQRVVGEINITCGKCLACREGRPTHCETRAVLGILNHNGAFADYLTVPLENLHLVPDSIPDEAAVFTEPLAAALEIQEQVKVRPSHRVLLIGAGRLGQLVARTLRLIGCDLQVVTRHEIHQQLLAEKDIATISEDQVRENAFDLVVDASGSPQGFSLARWAVRPKGVIVLKSTYKGEAQIDLSRFVVDEITIIGSRCGPFPPALRLLESREVDPLPLIEGYYQLSDGLMAFERATQPGTLKILLQPSSMKI